jgi:pyruvate dehydrogenase E1 component
MGATAGRTTLHGEGLQHDDGHSHLLASTLPNIRAYDPAFAYELAIIVREGIRRMFVDGEDVFYYLTVYNENWVQPARPDGVDEGVVRGLYRYRPAPNDGRRVQLLAAGSILHQALRAQEILSAHNVAADVWSATSFQQLRVDALDAERWNRLHPDAEPRLPYVSQALSGSAGPIIAATDYLKAIPDMVARWVGDRPYASLGTDGFGRSDTREALRTHFEVSPEHIAYAAVHGLCLAGEADREELRRLIGELGIDADRVNPQFA